MNKCDFRGKSHDEIAIFTKACDVFALPVILIIKKGQSLGG